MNEQRKLIILKEIIYWKENKMLPAHYCDFLLTLYSEGNEIEEEKLHSKNKSWIWNVCFFMFLPTTIALFYFTELSFILQMAISLIFLIFCVFGAVINHNMQRNVDIPATCGAILFLLMGISTVQHFFANEIIFLYIILCVNCLLWYYIGKRYNSLVFIISAFVGGGLLLLLLILPHIIKAW